MAQSFFERMQTRSEGTRPPPIPTVPWCSWCGACWTGLPVDAIRAGGWIRCTSNLWACGPGCFAQHNKTAPRFTVPLLVAVGATPVTLPEEPKTVADVGRERMSAGSTSSRRCAPCNLDIPASSVHLHCSRCSAPIQGLHLSPTMTEVQALARYVELGVLVKVGDRTYCGNTCASIVAALEQRRVAEAKAGGVPATVAPVVRLADATTNARHARSRATEGRAPIENLTTPAAPPVTGPARPKATKGA